MLGTQVPVQELEQIYTLRKPDEVIGYISENPFLIPLLKSAPQQINRFFPNAKLFLELFIDPDSLSYKRLTVYVGTIYDVAETLQRLYDLEEEWFDVFEKSNFKLSISVEFV